ncbi:hypothetical protein [Thiocapsa sp. N5-Cardenillas]|uniref:hypothetical protein n=1 Tax=Thiocapsa sp. N5-Cardenillas TaxID=3137397 RepID=UPI0035B4A01E
MNIPFSQIQEFPRNPLPDEFETRVDYTTDPRDITSAVQMLNSQGYHVLLTPSVQMYPECHIKAHRTPKCAGVDIGITT